VDGVSDLGSAAQVALQISLVKQRYGELIRKVMPYGLLECDFYLKCASARAMFLTGFCCLPGPLPDRAE
jgi:hypothetical protein